MEQNDQRNLMLAMLLMFGLFAIYNVFVQEPQARARKEAAARAQVEQVANTPAVAPLIMRSRDVIVAEETAAGQRVALDAPAVDGSISLKGSRIDDVSLKGFYDTIDDKLAERKANEVHLMEPDATERAFYATVDWVDPTGAALASLPNENSVWTQTSTGALTDVNPLTLTWTSAGATIERQISIDKNYMFTVTDKLTNTSASAINVEPRAVIRQRLLPEHLKPAPQAHAGVIGTYGTQKNQMRTYKDLNKGKGVSQTADKGWIGLTTKYWMAAVVPEQGEPVTMLASAKSADGRTMFNAGYTASPYAVQAGQSLTKSTRIFTGAKRVKVLDQYEHGGGIPAFTDAVDWSPFLFFITKPFFWLLQTFQGWFGSFGLAILALTVCVKTVFFPLQYKMYELMSKMRKLTPQVEAIKERFAADKARIQQETMKLYQTEKINPLAGCLPLIPQMFVFYSLYHTLVVTLEMRHTPFFGWIKDMSAPDPTNIFNLFGLIPWDPTTLPLIGNLFVAGQFLHIGVWPILYGATMFALQNLSPPPADPTQRMIMKWIPLVFLVLFAGVASGLAIYWVWSNTITLSQQYFIMRRTGVETEFDKFLKKRFGKNKEPA